MTKPKNRHHKFSKKQIDAIQQHYENYGWKVMWIAMQFRVHRSTIHFHIRTRGWVRKVLVAQIMPEKIAEMFRRKSKIRYVDRTYADTKRKKKKLVEGSYEYIKHMAEQQRLRTCQHVRWIKRCSICGKILESDSINHLHSVEMPDQKTINNQHHHE